jgi:uncharacterized repeat protein (TIGR02543 family)
MGYVNLIRKVVGATPTPTTGDYLVRSIDFDGTILKQEYVNHGQNATPMTHPTHDLLTADGYNNSYDNIQHDTDVGLIYKTTDGKTYLFMRFTPTTGLQPAILLNKATTDQMTITWGDGTSQTTSSSGNVTITKTNAYAAIGDYTVIIECAGNWSFYTYVFNNVADYNSCLIKCYLGSNFTRIGASTFQNCFSMSSIVVPNTALAASGNNCFRSCYSLTSIILPNGFSITGVRFLWDCPSLTCVVLPEGFTEIRQEFLIYGYSLTSIILPESITSFYISSFSSCVSITNIVIRHSTVDIYGGAFYNCFSILRYEILAVNPPSLGNINAFTGINLACKIYVPDASLTDYQGATNWVTYANYFYPISQLAEWNGTIFFQCNGGAAVKQIRGTIGSIATEPTAPTKAGFTFDGWYKEVGLITAWNWATDVYPDTNLTLYAKWI